MKQQPVVGILVLCALAGGMKWWNQKKPAPATPLATPAGGPFATANGPLDLRYWNRLNDLVSGKATVQVLPAAQCVQTLRATAAQIRLIPVVGVDRDLVQHALRIAELLDFVGSRVENADDPFLIFEAFERGRRGDVLGPVIDERQLQRNIDAVVRQISQEGFRLRAALSAKHRIEFRLPVF